MPDSATAAFLVELARALHVYGTPSHELEAAMDECSRSLGATAQFFSTPTAIFASFGSPGEARTTLVRVEPGDIDLSKLVDVRVVQSGVVRGDVSIEEARARLSSIEARPPRYSASLTTVAFAVATGTAAAVFGGGAREMAIAAGLGAIIDLVGRFTGRIPGAATVFQPLASFLAATLAALASFLLGGLAIDVVVLAALIVLVPGLSLTVALNELATRHLASGTARVLGAATQFLAIGFGAALGAKLALLIPGFVRSADPSASPGGLFALALVAAPFSFAVLFRAPPREFPWIFVASLAAFAAAFWGGDVVGAELGAFLGALVLGVSGKLYLGLSGRPAALLVVPGMLLLVPGSLGFRSFLALMEDDVIPGIEAAFSMAVIAIALVAGLLIADVLAASGRALGAER